MVVAGFSPRGRAVGFDRAGTFVGAVPITIPLGAQGEQIYNKSAIWSFWLQV